MTTDSLIEQLLNLHPHCDMTGVQRDAYGIARSDAIAIARRHLEGRPAVPGKPLELQTRDELGGDSQASWQPIDLIEKLRQESDKLHGVIPYYRAEAIVRTYHPAPYTAMKAIAEYPITDAGNMDAHNMQKIAIAALQPAPKETSND